MTRIHAVVAAGLLALAGGLGIGVGRRSKIKDRRRKPARSSMRRGGRSRKGWKTLGMRAR